MAQSRTLHLGMVKDEAELAPFEEYILSCSHCARHAVETADYVDAMRQALCDLPESAEPKIKRRETFRPVASLSDNNAQAMREGEKFRICPTGNEHTVGDMNCIGCEALACIRYPKPHQGGSSIIHLQFLVHGERVGSAFELFCEGGCTIAPINLAPPPSKD
jgi:hypothetical protein